MVQRLGSKLVQHNDTVLHAYLEGLQYRLDNLPVISDSIIVHPKDYGAIGDGVVDDTAAMQACVADAKRKGRGILIAGNKTYLISGLLVEEGVNIYGDNVATIKRTPNTSGDFISMSHRSGMYRVRIDGNKANQQIGPAAALVRVGDSDDVTVMSCQVKGAISYALVVNTGSRATVVKNTFEDVYNGGVAVYSSAADRYHYIHDNVFRSLGWGAIYLQYANRCVVSKNRCYGTFLGGRGKRQFVDGDGTRIVRLRAGDNFSSLRAGNFLVINGGGEYRITRIIDNNTIEVDREVASFLGYQALTGTGDLIGIQSCWNVDVDDNLILSTTTFGFGGGTMDGAVDAMHHCRFRNNRVEHCGKNGCNIGQTGDRGVGNCYITDNIFRNVGQGGDAVGLPDKSGINLHFGKAGYMSNMVVSGNKVESYYDASDTGQTNVWLHLTGVPTVGSVLLGDNWTIGCANNYIAGDVISIELSGWGDASRFTSYVSYGKGCTVAISTAGVGQLVNPWFIVNKACIPSQTNFVMSQMTSSNVGLMNTWGTQLSTVGSWKCYVSGTPAANGIMEFNLISV
ncbi:MAG: right-handed parallel beta-helix repeat-containing protein [Citrobacter telavivensis]